MPSLSAPPHWALRVSVLACLLLLSACTFTVQPPTPTPTAAPLTISGTVARGQTFTADLAPDLTLQLQPSAHGWEIWIGDPAHSTASADNFAMPVTPPFNTINTRIVEGWHFRNRDNSGPNVPGDKNVNAPQAVRTFCFVGNPDDFAAALAAFADGLPALAEAVGNDSLPVHRGTLAITSYTLGNLVANEQAWFETIEFIVTLDLDQPCELF